MRWSRFSPSATALADLECDILTGGGPGVMQAANEGAQASSNRDVIESVGIRIDLPFEQDTNPFVKRGYVHGTFFSRLHHFVLASDAFIVVPGGIGTTLEALTIWQLLQVGHLRDTPLIFAGDMWKELLEWARQFMLNDDNPLASEQDLNLPVVVSSREEAMEIIRRCREDWLLGRAE